MVRANIMVDYNLLTIVADNYCSHLNNCGGNLNWIAFSVLVRGIKTSPFSVQNKDDLKCNIIFKM